MKYRKISELPNLISVFLMFCLIAGTASAVEAPTEESNKLYVVNSANKLEESIRNRGELFVDNQLVYYLESILKKMFPRIHKDLRVNLYASTLPNAFVLANGSMYVSVGLLARVRNEAQIAAVLSHEAAHYISEHILSKHVQLQEIAYDLEFLGVNRTLSELSDFSMEVELEADRFGYYQLFSTGYSTEEMISTLKVVEKHTPHQKNNQRIQQLDTHPSTKERVQQVRELIADEKDTNMGFVGENEYLRNTVSAVQKYLQLVTERYRFDDAINVFEQKSTILSDSPTSQYYIGEAYRQRNGGDDLQRAQTAYSTAIKLDPNYALPYYKLGVIGLKQKDVNKAKENFSRFLQLDPEAVEAPFVKYYLENAIASGGQQ